MSNFILACTWILHETQTAGARGLWKIYRKKLNIENILPIYISPVNLEKITVIHF